MDAFRSAIEAAWDWAEERQVGVRLRRADEWLIRITLGDCYGKFVEDVPLPFGSMGSGPATDEALKAMRERFHARLDVACRKARAARAEAMNRRLSI